MRAVWIAAILLLAAPVAAQADSVTISAPPEAAIGGKSTISVAVEDYGPADELYVVRRRVDAGPPCGPDQFSDYSAAEGSGTKEVGSVRQGTQTGTYNFEVEWIDQGIRPGEWRFCAWLRAPGGEQHTTSAPEARTTVRMPRATIRIDSARQQRTYVDAGDLTTGYRIAVSGTREVPLDVDGLWKREGSCPDSTVTDRPITFSIRRAAGPFDSTGFTGGPDVLLGRSYVLCVYVVSPWVEDGIVAVARRVVEPKTRPLAEGRPGVSINGLPVRRLRCSDAYWAAYPRRIRYAYRWFRDGRRVGRGRTLAVGRRDNGHRFVCQVTARNAVGATTKRSSTYRLRDA